MAININGSGTITGVSVGGLPDGIVDTDMLATSAVTVPKIGYTGAILQVVSATKTDVATTTSTSATAVTGFSASITPRVSGSNVLVMVSCALSNETSDRGTFIWLYKDGSVVSGATGDASGVRQRVPFKGRKTSSAQSDSAAFNYLDSTTGTSSITYQIYFAAESGTTAVLGRDGNTGDQTHLANYPSTITLLEVAA